MAEVRKGWTKIEVLPRPIEETLRARCTYPGNHIWSPRGNYCVMCNLEREKPLATRQKQPGRPKFNRAHVIPQIALRDCGNASWLWCFYCTVGLTKDTVTLDHATPLSKGRHLHNLANARLCCATCNHVKGDQVEAEFRASEWLIARQRYVARLRAAEVRP